MYLACLPKKVTVRLNFCPAIQHPARSVQTKSRKIRHRSHVHTLLSFREEEALHAYQTCQLQHYEQTEKGVHPDMTQTSTDNLSRKVGIDLDRVPRSRTSPEDLLRWNRLLDCSRPGVKALLGEFKQPGNRQDAH